MTTKYLSILAVALLTTACTFDRTATGAKHTHENMQKMHKFFQYTMDVSCIERRTPTEYTPFRKPSCHYTQVFSNRYLIHPTSIEHISSNAGLTSFDKEHISFIKGDASRREKTAYLSRQTTLASHSQTIAY